MWFLVAQKTGRFVKLIGVRKFMTPLFTMARYRYPSFYQISVQRFSPAHKNRFLLRQSATKLPEFPEGRCSSMIVIVRCGLSLFLLSTKQPKFGGDGLQLTGCAMKPAFSTCDHKQLECGVDWLWLRICGVSLCLLGLPNCLVACSSFRFRKFGTAERCSDSML
jgi:hypothetical protein